MLTAREARDNAAQWGSYMTGGDPGAVFYSLNGDDYQIRDEEHRQELIAYCKKCIENETDEDNREMLADLLAYFEKTPTADQEMWASTSSGRIELKMTFEQAHSASHQGQCDDDVEALSKRAEITEQLEKIDPAVLRDELREYGFEEEKLDDHDANLQRILWLMAGDIVEETR